MQPTLKEELTFSMLSTIFMVAIMLSFNALRLFGLHAQTLTVIITQFIPIALAAFLISQLVVGHNVHKLHRIIVAPHHSEFKKITIFSVLMVTGMCASMTLYVHLVTTGTGQNFWKEYLSSITYNYPVALIAQLLVVGPLVRRLHVHIFAKTDLVE